MTEPYDAARLPEVVTTYLRAHDSKDFDTAISTFAPDAIVVDDGKTYRGTPSIRSWLAASATEFTFTSEPRGQILVDDRHVTVINHIEGNFPGGRLDLRYQFELAASHQITGLRIEV